MPALISILSTLSLLAFSLRFSSFNRSTSSKADFNLVLVCLLSSSSFCILSCSCTITGLVAVLLAGLFVITSASLFTAFSNLSSLSVSIGLVATANTFCAVVGAEKFTYWLRSLSIITASLVVMSFSIASVTMLSSCLYTGHAVSDALCGDLQFTHLAGAVQSSLSPSCLSPHLQHTSFLSLSLHVLFPCPYR